MAESAFKEKDYRSAVTYYKNAIKLNPDELSVRLDLVDVYFILDEEFKAVSLLEETVEQDKSAYDAYKELLGYYEKKNDLDAIMDLLDGVTNNRVKNLFKNYIVESPNIHLEGGTYNNSIRITLSAKMGTSIYYTIDGSNPEKRAYFMQNRLFLIKRELIH
jgi:tetratricopeptide (TPR) repeat protein